MLHELINPYKPQCLYCHTVFKNNDMSLKSSSVQGSSLASSMMRFDQENLHCNSCKETFEILSHQNDEGVSEYIAFTFTCKDYSIFYDYAQSIFYINDRKGNEITAIPFFNPDFSIKDKLYEKIKTYVVFS